MRTKSRVEYKPIAWVSEIQLCVLSMALSSTACPSLLLVSCGSNLPDQDGQVLGADLNRSESSRQPACPRLSLPPPLANAALAASRVESS